MANRAYNGYRNDMNDEEFENQIEEFKSRRPFEPYLLRFEDSGYVLVDHPEALIFRGGRIVYVDPAGRTTFSTPDGVTRVEDVGQVEDATPRRT